MTPIFYVLLSHDVALGRSIFVIFMMKRKFGHFFSCAKVQLHPLMVPMHYAKATSILIRCRNLLGAQNRLNVAAYRDGVRKCIIRKYSEMISFVMY